MRNYLMTNKKWFITLLVIWLIIAVISVKSQFFLSGWDNYSSYFNSQTNIFRTLFSTWRDYRGLGSPSDSEVVDLPRQVFNMAISSVLPLQLADQIYFMIALLLGILGVYFFVDRLCREYIPNKLNGHTVDFIAFVSAFFYLFNLNTLAIFYYPILPYITRFATLPLIFLLFAMLLKAKNISRKTYLLLILVLFVSTTSYLTATVFITLMMSLLIFSIFSYVKDKKKLLMIWVFFLLSNSFWLLPFANYTLQKAAILKVAPIFISANESQLNKPKRFYEFKKQILLMPNFFGISVSKIDTSEKIPLYNNLESLNKPLSRVVLHIFPILYLIGSMILLVRYKRLTWIPVSIGVFLFLSMKEYSPIGFIYELLDKRIPFFGIVFRFGDTKFHPHIAFAGSIASGFALYNIKEWIGSIMNKVSTIAYYIQKALLPLIVVFTVIVYKTYFTGNLIGFFMYNSIPKAYFDVAKVINEDKDDFRVIHLPIDNQMYWKSYSWGYLGSEFFHNLIDKPFFDKTFEPASQENADALKVINSHVSNLSSDSYDYLSNQAELMYSVLQKYGIKYILVDQSLSAEQTSRNIITWGKFDSISSQKVLTIMYEKNYVSKPRIFPISLTDNSTNSAKNRTNLFLYEVVNVRPKIYSPKSYIPANGYSLSLLNKYISNPNTTYLDDGSVSEGVVFPLLLKPDNWVVDNKTVRIPIESGAHTNSRTLQLSYDLEPGKDYSSVTHSVSVFASRRDDGIHITLYNEFLPFDTQSARVPIGEILISNDDIERTAMYGSTNRTDYLSNWHIIDIDKIGPFRLRLDKSIVPIPFELDHEEKYVANAMVHTNPFVVSILTLNSKVSLPVAQLALTEKPNCLTNNSDGYQFNFDAKSSEGVNLAVKNGSLCFWNGLESVRLPKSSHIEIGLKIKYSPIRKNQVVFNDKSVMSKHLFKNSIGSLMPYINLKICIKDSQRDECLNNHQNLKLQSDTDVIVPVDLPIDDVYDLVNTFSLENYSQQIQAISLKTLTVDQFEILQQGSIFINNDFLNAISIAQIKTDGIIDVAIPKSLSPYAYFHNIERDGYEVSNGICNDGSKRIYSIISNSIQTYAENCSTVVSQRLPFTNNANIVWRINYNLLSGQFPIMKVSDKSYTSYYDYASINNGYPDIDGFKLFQNPENIFTDKRELVFNLQNLIKHDSIAQVQMNQFANDNKIKQYSLEQYSENEGSMLIGSFDIIEAPSYWEDFKIATGDKNNLTKSSSSMQIKYLKQILPSLWQISVDKVNTTNEGNEALLYFNEGFDMQWGLYDSLISVIGGKSLAVKHGKCDGYANCFLLSNTNLTKNNNRLYIFYAPERLAILGWTLTGLIWFFGRRLFNRHRKVIHLGENET